MIRREEVYKIGKLGKAHGVKGEVTFMFDDDVFDRVEADYLVLDLDGILVPFFMEEYRFRSDSTALVKFCDIDTQERARELTNAEVFFPYALSDEEGPMSFDGLVGYTIVDAVTSQPIGTIATVDDQTINLLFELEDGTLIPAHEELIVDIDQEARKLVMNIPAGLIE